MPLSSRCCVVGATAWHLSSLRFDAANACVSLLHAARPPRRPGLLPLASMLVFHFCLPPGTPPSVCSPSACSFASPSAPAPRLDRPGIHACVSLLHAARPRLDRPGIHACLGLIALASMLVFHCCMPLVLVSSDLISLAPRLLYFRKCVLVCQPVRPGAQACSPWHPCLCFTAACRPSEV